jgi:hypothetical protein
MQLKMYQQKLITVIIYEGEIRTEKNVEVCDHEV